MTWYDLFSFSFPSPKIDSVLSIDRGLTQHLDIASILYRGINSRLLIIAWAEIGKIISWTLTPTPDLVGSILTSDLCIRRTEQWSWWAPASPPLGFACSCPATRPPPSEDWQGDSSQWERWAQIKGQLDIITIYHLNNIMDFSLNLSSYHFYVFSVRCVGLCAPTFSPNYSFCPF